MMKLRYIILVTILSILAFPSCIDTYDEPVETCTAAVIDSNDTNPYNALYQAILDDYVAKGIPGLSVAIETPEHGWWIGCSGVASIEDQISMEPCHVHHSSSTIKPYIATLIMRLYEDNKLDIDDPIREYLPADLVSKVANADVATIRHLLSHTSGQRNGYYYDKALVDMLNDPEEFVSTAYMFEKYAYGRPALSAPGEEFHYSNIGYDMLGMIIEEVSEMSLGAYFKQEIIDPLGLENTYYKAYPGYPDEIPNVINRYARIKPGQLVNCTDIENKLANVSMGNVGLYATPYEFARFYQELLRGNILEPATLELMTKDQVQLHSNPAEELYYCLGLHHSRSSEFAPKYYHGGQNYGTSSLVLYFPDDDITISYSANMDSMFGDLGIFYDLWDELEKVTFTGSRE